MVGMSPHSGQTMDRRIERKIPRWARRAATGGLILMGVVGVALVFRPNEGRALRVTSEAVTISTVTRGTFEDFIPIRARVTPATTVYLDAIEGGRVEEVLVEDGVYLKKGQLIARLSNTALQLDVISREAEVSEQINNAQTLELQLEQNRIANKRNIIEAEYQVQRLTRLVERRRQLVPQGHVSREDYEASEDELAYWQRLLEVRLEAQKSDERLQRAQLAQISASLEQLKHNLVFARTNLDNLNITAPFEGQLTAFDLEVGQSVEQGERIGQIDDPDSFKLVALIDEFYINRIDIAQTATAEIAGRGHQLYVKKIYSQVREGQFEIDLAFQEDAPSDIRRGQTIQTRLALGDPSPAVLIPNGAFYLDTGGDWVFVVGSDTQEAIRRRVKLGRRNARFIEVLDGLEPGERIITSPYNNYLDMTRLLLSE